MVRSSAKAHHFTFSSSITIPLICQTWSTSPSSPPPPWGQVPGFTGDACIIFHLSKLLFSGFFRRKSNFFLVKITQNAQIELCKPLTWLKNVWRSITIVLTCLIVFDKILKTSSFYQTFSSFKHVWYRVDTQFNIIWSPNDVWSCLVAKHFSVWTKLQRVASQYVCFFLAEYKLVL